MAAFLLIMVYVVIWASVASAFGMWGLLLGWIVPEVLFRMIGSMLL